MLSLDERTAWKEAELDGDRERRGWVWRRGCSVIVFMVVSSQISKVVLFC
jgi:hypothetical protein